MMVMEELRRRPTLAQLVTVLGLVCCCCCTVLGGAEAATAPMTSGGATRDGDGNAVLPWPQYRRFSNRTGAADALTFKSPPTLKWAFEVRDGVVDGSFAIAMESIFFGTSAGTVHALSTASGDVLWNATVGGAVVSAPCLVQGGAYVVVTARDGFTYKLDAKFGYEEWRANSGAPISGSPVLLPSDLVVIANDAGMVIAYDMSARHFTRLWEVDSKEAVRASPAATRDLVIISTMEGLLLAINIDRGEEAWRLRLMGALWNAPALLESRGLLFVGTDAFVLQAVAFNSTGAEATWSVHYEVSNAYGSVTPAIGDATTVVFGGWDFTLSGYDARTGQARWSFPTGNWLFSSPIADAAGGVAFGGVSTVLTLLNTTAQPLASSLLNMQGRVMASPAADENGTLYISTRAGFVYAVAAAKPRRIQDTGIIVVATVAAILLVVVGTIAFYCHKRLRRPDLYASLPSGK